MGWELIGGDPAPGSPETVRGAATALNRVSQLASQARTDLNRNIGHLDIAAWKGSAAAAFRSDVHELPDRLGELDDSFATAGQVCDRYRMQLEQAQADARTALAAAQQADADRHAAEQRLSAARQEADGLRGQQRSANLRVAGLVAQSATAIDPGHRAAVDSQLASARARANRLHADIQAADQTTRRHAAAVRDAEARLTAARDAAEKIREWMKVAVTAVVTGLATAEKKGDLPGFVERFSADAKKVVATYGPVVADSFEKGSEWFSLAGSLFPPGAVVFKTASLIVGGIGLVAYAASEAADGDGLTTDDLLELGHRSLELAVTATSLGTLGKAATAARMATASTWLNRTDESVQLVQATREHGPEGLVTAGGTMVFGGLLGKAADHGLSKASIGLQTASARHPAAASALDRMAASVGHSNSTVLGVPLVTDSSSRAAQSLLMSHGRTGGEFLFGNQAATNPRVTAHLMGAPQVGLVRDELAEAIPDQVASEVRDHQLKPPEPQPEIDINFDPSPYGDRR